MPESQMDRKHWIHRVGKFYSSIFIDNIGLILFAGILSVLFQEHGWLPNHEIYGISQMVYTLVLPLQISYAGGKKVGEHTGGIVAILFAVGILYRDPNSAILAGMIAAPIGGYLWIKMEKNVRKWIPSSMQMLGKNLLVGVLGGILSVGGYYLISPAISKLMILLSMGLQLLMKYRLSGVICIFIEPLKVFFLNNVINHGVLVPLGIQQAQKWGESVLFLIETNPGPGLGMLAAHFYYYKNRRGQYAALTFAEAVGGIHEVYFPMVLSDFRLLIPLILGSVAGTVWFDFMNAGVGSAISPGSVITVLLMAGKGNVIKILAGILISAGAAYIGTRILLEISQKNSVNVNLDKNKIIPENLKMKTELSVDPSDEFVKKPIHKVGFICDAGIGSSAMAAALFRKELVQQGIIGIRAEAYASDRIPEELDLLVCQHDFAFGLSNVAKEKELFFVDNLMDTAVYQSLAEMIRKRNG